MSGFVRFLRLIIVDQKFEAPVLQTPRLSYEPHDPESGSSSLYSIDGAGMRLGPCTSKMEDVRMNTQTAKVINFPTTCASAIQAEIGTDAEFSDDCAHLQSANAHSLIKPLPRKSHWTQEELATLVEMAKTLPKTKLRDIFNLEANSHRNMKRRRKKGERTVHPDFEGWQPFLIFMLENHGPCPGKGYTVDRIDNPDLEYAPGKVRWADKTEQNNNKGNTIYLEPEGHPRRPLMEWVRLTNQKEGTLRARLSRKGWTDTEVVFGRKNNKSKADNLSPWPTIWPDDPSKWEDAEERYQQNPNRKISRHEWLLKRLNQVQSPVEAQLIEWGYEFEDPETGEVCIPDHLVGEHRRFTDRYLQLERMRARAMNWHWSLPTTTHLPGPKPYMKVD